MLRIRYDEDDEPRDELLARVDLDTGELTTEPELSRTAYDWTCDIITFRVYKQQDEFVVEEGVSLNPQADMAIDPDDLGALRGAWSDFLAQRMDASLPAGSPNKGPRL